MGTGLVKATAAMSFTGDVMHGQAVTLGCYSDPRAAQVEAPMAWSYGTYQFTTAAWADRLQALRLVLARERARALTIMLLALVVGVCSIWLTRPVYSAWSTIQIAQTMEDHRAFQKQIHDTAENVANNLHLANDRLFLRDVGLNDQPAGPMRTAKVGSALQERLSVSSPRYTNVVTIRYDSHDPVTAARIANTFAESFTRDSLERQLFSDDFLRGLRRGQVEVAEARLEDAERSLGAAGVTGSGGNPQTGSAARLADLNDAYSRAQTNLVEAEQRWQQAVSRSQIGNAVSIVDRAEPPARPAYPRPATNLALAALLGALAVGGDIARRRTNKREYWRSDANLDFDASSPPVVSRSPSPQTADEQKSDKVTRSDDVERDLDAPSPVIVPPAPSPQTSDGRMSGKARGTADLHSEFDAPLLGVVPSPGDGEEAELAMLDLPPGAPEAHHAIFLALDEIVRTADHRVLLLTSSSQYEGKSMIAVKLAASFAGSGKKVLMIDADMRCGSLHRTGGVSNCLGFANLLAPDSTDRLTVVAQSSAVPGLSIVPRGAPATNPTDLLASRRLADLLDEAVDLYDIVIMDGPPALGLVDAPCLSGMADATVFVFQANRTPREDAKLAIRRLSEAGAGQIALVISTCDSGKDFGVLDHVPSYNQAAALAEQSVAPADQRPEYAPSHLEPLD